MKFLLKITAVFVMVSTLFMFGSCSPKNQDDIDEENSEENTEENGEENEEDQTQNPRVVITLWDDREIRLELFPETAPITVANFLELVDSGYYTNTIFHRIIENFMIQAGMLGYDSELFYKPQQDSITGEFASNGYPNPLKHKLGVISMARTTVPNSASAQFFICSATSPHLDGDYAAFGKTIDDESNQVVLQLSQYPTYTFSGMNDFPLTPEDEYVIIKSIERLEIDE